MAITPTDFTFRQPLTGISPSASNNGQLLLITEANVHDYFWNNVASGGGAVRVCEDAEGLNQLPVHVLLCDTGLKELKVWVRKPVYSSGSRDLYLFSKDTGSALADNHEFGKYNVWQDYSRAWFSQDTADHSGNSANLLTAPYPCTVDNFVPTGDTPRTITTKFDASPWEGYSTLNKHIYYCTPSGQIGWLLYSKAQSDRCFKTNMRGGFGATSGLKCTSLPYVNDTEFDYDHIVQWGSQPSLGQKILVSRGLTTSTLEETSKVTNNYNGTEAPLIGTDQGFDYEYFLVRNELASNSFLETEAEVLKDPTSFWTLGQYDFPNQTKYDDVTNQINTAHPLSTYCRAAFLAKGVTGNDLVETVSQASHTFVGPIIHNGDGSVRNTDGTELIDVDPTHTWDMQTDGVIMFLDGERSGNNAAAKYSYFMAGKTSVNFKFVRIQSSSYGNGWYFNSNRNYNGANSGDAISNIMPRTQVFGVFDGPAGTAELLLHKESYGVGTHSQNNPAVPTGFEVGLGGNNTSTWGGYTLIKSGAAFTQAEIDSIIADPYAMFEVATGGGGATLTASVTGAGSVVSTQSKATDITLALTDAGNTAATIAKVSDITTSVTGVGTIPATVGNLVNITTSVTGTGTTAATIAKVSNITTSVADAGTTAATIAKVGDITASVTDVGTTAATIAKVSNITTSVTGVGTIPATAGNLVNITTSVTGAGTTAATIAKVGDITASVTDVGTTAATIAKVSNITTSVTGVGTIPATAGNLVNITTSVTGAGTTAVTIAKVGDITLALTDAGTTAATIAKVSNITTAVTGVGTIPATIGNAVNITTSVTGTGTTAATIAKVSNITASVTGVGTIPATLDGAAAIVTTVSGVGAAAATIAKTASITSALSGAGAISATALPEGTVVTTVSGVGSALVGVITKAVATNEVITAAGSIVASILATKYTTGALSGVGTCSILIDGQVIPTNVLSLALESKAVNTGLTLVADSINTSLTLVADPINTRRAYSATI